MCDDFQARLLIAEQIIVNYKLKEDEAQVASDEAALLMTDKLDNKEYALQVCELKIHHYEKYLQRKALVEVEALNLLDKF